jgi:hypothetical protein
MWAEIKVVLTIYFAYFTSEYNFLLSMISDFSLSLKITFKNEPWLNTAPDSSISLLLWAHIHCLLSVYGLADARNWSETALMYETQTNTSEAMSLPQAMQGINTDEQIIWRSVADWLKIGLARVNKSFKTMYTYTIILGSSPNPVKERNK